MVRLIITVILFLLSLLCIFSAPAYYLWYVSILVTEFPWIFLIITALLLIWSFKVRKFRETGTMVAMASFVLFLRPVGGAYIVAHNLPDRLDNAFGKSEHAWKSNITAAPFAFTRMIAGLSDTVGPYRTMSYTPNSPDPLALDYYAASQGSRRPCVIVVHGGSWAAGDSHQLPLLNSYLVKAGYNVASINYRLAPHDHWPAPVEDVHTAMDFLRANSAELLIDTSNFVLLGRSAGGQIVLSAAYTLHDTGIKGVINFYGPTDMVWGYKNPANPLVLNTCKVMEDYLGGTYDPVPRNYVASSATETVAAGSVPTLTIHGKNDPLVAYEHSTRLDKKLQVLGVPHLLLTLPWATHGCDYSLNSPSGQLSTYAVLRFLNKVTRQ